MKRGTAAVAGVAVLVGWLVSSVPATDVFTRGASAKSSDVCKNGPLSQPRPNCAPPPPPSTGDQYEDCVARINQLRWKCQCLPPLRRWKGGETCANQQARYDAKHGIHAGFNREICEPHGRAQNECPAWPSTKRVVDECLQSMWDEGPGKRFSKHGHYLNMSGDHEAVACGLAKGSDGRIWSVQNFR